MCFGFKTKYTTRLAIVKYVNYSYTSWSKYSYTAKYSITDCAIYRLNIHLELLLLIIHKNRTAVFVRLSKKFRDVIKRSMIA